MSVEGTCLHVCGGDVSECLWRGHTYVVEGTCLYVGGGDVPVCLWRGRACMSVEGFQSGS